MNPDFDTSIINVANDFYEAYLRCSEGRNPIVDEFNRVHYEAPNIPAIVNGAFALELYLKSMSKLSDEELKKKKHRIKALILSLDQPIQDQIRREVEPKLQSYQNYDKCLSGISNAFTFWRYIHTKQDFGFGLNETLKVLELFVNAARNIANAS